MHTRCEPVRLPRRQRHRMSLACSSWESVHSKFTRASPHSAMRTRRRRKKTRCCARNRRPLDFFSSFRRQDDERTRATLAVMNAAISALFSPHDLVNCKLYPLIRKNSKVFHTKKCTSKRKNLWLPGEIPACLSNSSSLYIACVCVCVYSRAVIASMMQ